MTAFFDPDLWRQMSLFWMGIAAHPDEIARLLKSDSLRPVLSDWRPINGERGSK